MSKVITFGEILLRLSPPGFQRFSQTQSFEANYGGSESNVAVTLANFGIPVEFVTRLPKNDFGRSAEIELRKRGVGTGHIIYGGERLGIYFLETGAAQRGSKVIYDRSHTAMATIKKGTVDWEEVFKDAVWFHWSGITPAISQEAAEVCKEAIATAKDFDVPVSIDLNYRSKLWKYGKEPQEVMPELVQKCDLIYSSTYAAEEYFNIYPDSLSQTSPHQSICEKLMQRFPKARRVVTTLRGTKSASHNSWSGILFNGQDFIEAPTYQITPIVDRVGGGDAFMGGLIYGLLSYESDKRALDFAIAASCLKHTIPGDYNLSTIEEVEKLMKGDSSGHVSR